MSDYKDPESFAVIEPRIYHIAQELQRILSLVQLEVEGKPVEVTGFRLRDLSTWQDHGSGSSLDALAPISGLCNSRCRFCFEHGIPFARELSLMPVAEARTRLKYYSPETGKCLFPSNRPQMETFIHPQGLEIIEMARRRDPDKIFWITTNGAYLDEKTVARLAALKPLMLKLSLNVSDPELHRWLMGMGKRTSTAIASPRLLRQYQIPFIGGIVAWPGLPFQAIEDTVHYLESCQAYAIRIRLPLFHKWVREQPDCDFHEHWQQVAEFCHELRGRCGVPLLVEPPLYWVNAILPEVDGVILNSPATRAGLRPGDLVRAINGVAVMTRTASEALLHQCRLGAQPAEIVVERQGELFQYCLQDLPGLLESYPYDPSHCYKGENYGVLHVEDFRLKYVQQIFDLADRYKTTDVMLFTSPLVAPIFETIVNHVPEYVERLKRTNLYIESIFDNMLGGNYDVMDSRFVQDYARVIRQRLKQGLKIGLILIPNAFGSPWGTDFTGASYAQLEIEFGIPVELIDWYLVYGPDI